MEAAIRWSPHSTEDSPRFMIVDVASNRLQLCEIGSLDSKNFVYKDVVHRGNLPNFTAFDWSKSRESLVAIGLSTGEAAVLRLDNESTQSDITHVFPIKHTRKCNTIAFSSRNLLATGLDRIRNDFSMNVYSLDSDSRTAQTEPYRKLSSSEAITSIKFFAQQPQTLLAGVSRQCVRLYDLRDNSGLSAAQFSTRQVHNIAIDPFDDNYFVSAGPSNEPVVAIWDRRFVPKGNPNQSDGITYGAVLELRPAVDNRSSATIWSLRYSSTKRGCFSILSSSGEIRVMELAQKSSKINNNGALTGRDPSSLGESGHFTKISHCLKHPWRNEQGPEETTRVVSTDFVGSSSGGKPRLLTLLLNHKVQVLDIPGPPFHVDFIASNEVAICGKESTILQDYPKTHSIAEELSYLQRKAISDGDFPPLKAGDEIDAVDERFTKLEMENTSKKSKDGRMSGTYPSSRELHEELLCVHPPLTTTKHQNSLKLLDVQRRRCKDGYLFNCEHNKRITANDPWLVDLWDLVERLVSIAKDSGMVFHGLDLSYVGVYSIWTKLAKVKKMRNRASQGKTVRNGLDSAVAEGLCESKGCPEFDGVKTDFPHHRQICLAICGWLISRDELERRSIELIDNGEGYRAIVLAMFKGYKGMALTLLRYCIQQGKLKNIGLGAVIACEKVNKEQQEHCSWMAEETNDPYLKALLTYFVSGNWISVLNMQRLSLIDRVGIALKRLDDKALDAYLESAVGAAVGEGDIEGIVLTGLDPLAMDLLQAYVAKSNDLQTAVLAMAFSCPVYVDDLRWEIWKETYFMQMQAWRCFLERTRFIVEHNKRAISKDSRRMNAVPPNQVALRCNHCLGSLARREKSNSRSEADELVSGKDYNIGSPKAAAGIVCPKCGRHMPRCGICMMWLGTPDPSKASAASALAGEDVMAKLITFCMRCNHGFHSHHARDWFVKHRLCPIPSCRCLCGYK